MLAGQPTDHLDAAAGLTEGTFDEIGVPGPGPVLTREPQVHRQRVAVVEQAPHRRRIGVAPTLFERIDPLLRVPDRVQTRLDRVGHVEDRPVVGLHLRLGVLGHLGQHVSGAMHQAALPQRGTHGPLERADQPGRAVADHQQRAGQPAFAEPGEGNPSHASPDSLDAASSPTNTGLLTSG